MKADKRCAYVVVSPRFIVVFVRVLSVFRSAGSRHWYRLCDIRRAIPWVYGSFFRIKSSSDGKCSRRNSRKEHGNNVMPYAVFRAWRGKSGRGDCFCLLAEVQIRWIDKEKHILFSWFRKLVREAKIMRLWLFFKCRGRTFLCLPFIFFKKTRY